ncbi:hypothetical protein [Xanthomonas retroflexus]|uniref:hypothetical protein n=1 Tax=Stenotrophomonas indicatrix TaxID=2045451 RepID=UPI000B430F69
MQIQISGQYGDPQSGNLFFPLQQRLNTCFEHHVTGNYFQTITSLAIGLRVSGKIQDFESEGPERLKLFLKKRRMTMDLVYAHQPWETRSRTILAPVVSHDIACCLGMMVERARRAGELLQHDQLRTDVANALADFERHFLQVAS